MSSLWDEPEGAEASGSGIQPQMRKLIANQAEDTPVVENCNMFDSTVHKSAAAAA